MTMNGRSLQDWKRELGHQQPLPRDLQHFEGFWRGASAAFSQQLGLLVFTAQLKFGPAREAFLKYWKQHHAQGAVERMHRACSKMLQDMSEKQDELDVWVAEVGGHLKVHGYQATASTMGFLSKAKRGGTGPFVRLGATRDKKGQRQLFKILPLSAAQLTTSALLWLLLCMLVR